MPRDTKQYIGRPYSIDCPYCGKSMVFLTSVPPKLPDGTRDLNGKPIAHIYGCAACGIRKRILVSK